MRKLYRIEGNGGRWLGDYRATASVDVRAVAYAAARMLEAHGIPCIVMEYEVFEDIDKK